jgi:DNA-directed RNA polymerase subunit K/omega
MPIPLDALLQDNRNIYELTSATIRRAHQLGEIRRAFSSDENGAIVEDDEQEKVVSQAITEIITDTVRFEITED